MDGTGDFSSIQEAVDAAACDHRAPAIIHIGAGVYREKLRITRDNLCLVGEDPGNTTIVFGDYAKQILPDHTNHHSKPATCAVVSEPCAAGNGSKRVPGGHLHEVQKSLQHMCCSEKHEVL
jgi:pectin methylesterase-like acyl-CoA thioesterase